MPKKTILIAAAVLAIAAASGCADLPRPHMPGPAMGATGTPAATQAVTAAAERLRLAMIDPTPAALGALVADDLSYGHSAGRVDTKASFIADLMDGKSDFVTLVISDQTVKVVGDAAIVRHTLTADTNDAGKPGKVAIKVLGVWQRQADGAWRLLARQAVRPPV
ncbi:nuclear transport factor 2 family protein [Comamonadaceae bacterium OTU4NAUVB1]|nr:nuclear transport factor 2 family protein [Comamonadaceae bacterium OTU4NAUVB1]HSU21669.1 nuclear transport factor 2 family protein [Variovorax sp.]